MTVKIKRWLYISLALLMTILLPASVYADDDWAVYDGSLLYNIGAGSVTVLGSKNDEVPETVKIRAEVNGVKIKTISGWGFYYSKAKQVILPKTIEQIREYAFANSNIRELIIPSNVVFLDRASVMECKYLEKVVFKTNKVRELPVNAFSFCTNLKEITLPPKLEKIEYGAFIACKSLEKITLPNTLKIIDEAAFSECTSLSEIYIPPSIVHIAGNAFSGAKKLTIKGAKNSYAQYYARANKIPFKAVGSAAEPARDRPMIKSVNVKGNTAKVELFPDFKKGTEYVFAVLNSVGLPLERLSLYPSIRRVTTKNNSVTFYNLPKGELIVYAMLSKYEDKKEKFSNGMMFCIDKAPVNTPKLAKAAVKGRTVTVTVTNTRGSKGYDCVLSKRWGEKPYGAVYVKKNRRSSTVTFKNVKPGEYYVGAHAFVRTNITSGRKEFSDWSNYKRIMVR